MSIPSEGPSEGPSKGPNAGPNGDGGGWHRAWIGLGGNVGDVRANMAAAVAAIDALDTARVAAVSPLYRTAPWGDTDQPDFLNACLRIETCLPPLDLLDRLKAIEKELKRRKTRRWGPRTIDLDILVYQGEAVAHERLAIPHPRMLDRVFVLRPLADIDPALEIAGRTVADWLSRLESDDGIGKEAGPDWAGVKPGGQ